MLAALAPLALKRYQGESSVKGSSLWQENGAVIHYVRRMG